MCDACGLFRDTMVVALMEVVFPDISFEGYKDGNLCRECATKIIVAQEAEKEV
jgi:rubredoxin